MPQIHSMRTALALAALLTSTAHAVVQQDAFDPLNKAFDKTVEELLNVLHIPGLSIAVVQGDKIASKVCHRLIVLLQCNSADKHGRAMAFNGYQMSQRQQIPYTTQVAQRKRS